MDKDIFLQHLTITTGHSRQSYRREVADSIMPAMQDILSRMLAGEAVPLPGDEGAYLTGVAVEDSLVATVWVRDADKNQIPLVTIGVSEPTPGGQHLWRLLHERTGLPLVTTADTPPAHRWCAARLDIGAQRYPDVMSWMGDFERCLAWAWFERKK